MTSKAPVNVIPVSSIPAVNVAAVPQRSPLRYPGGKTWLIPHIRHWLQSSKTQPRLLIEPFAGGATVTLTAVMEGCVDRAIMAELDRDVAAFWHVALHHNGELIEEVQRFRATRFSVKMIDTRNPRNLLEHGFRTLVLNRTRRGGILAPGAALSREGENGKGVASRWYADTLVGRLKSISEFADRITFCETDGLSLLESLLPGSGPDTMVFVDPPYTAGGKKAGSRLYAHSELDHSRLFHILAKSQVNFLMTYDYAAEVLNLVEEHGFEAVQVLMRNTHHNRLPELVISRSQVFAEAE